MGKRLSALVMALALCLGLAIPTLAADTSGLEAKEAKAYYDTLSAYGGKGVYVAYADVKCLGGSKDPELVVVTVPKDQDTMIQYATVDVWRMKGGSPAQVYHVEFEGSQENGICYVTKGGNTYLLVSIQFMRQGVYGGDYTYIGADAVYEELYQFGDYNTGESEAERFFEGTVFDITEDQLRAFMDAYHVEGEALVASGGLNWYMEEKHHSSYQNTLNKLLARSASATAAPAAGTYGPYTIIGDEYDGLVYTVSFSAAKVEKKTVQLRRKMIPAFGGEPEISSYQNVELTLVTMKADSSVTVRCGNDSVADIPGACAFLQQDGNGRYTRVSEEFDMEFLAEEDVRTYIKKGAALIETYHEDQEERYIVEYEAADTANAPSAGGFTDVKSGAYYEEAVKWAVEKKITGGTTATTFSPNNTCTVAQILTFLWRANGAPEPAGRSPFSDISSGDYYYKAAVWAAGRGLVSGSKFNPNTPCTRSMVVTYLWKLNGSPATAPGGFTDVSAKAGYAQAVAWAVKNGITSGTTATTFSPDTACTRGQIVTFLYRAMGK